MDFGFFNRTQVAHRIGIAAHALCGDAEIGERLFQFFLTAHIQDRDLNFQINFDGQDELGQLCAAFEKMRQTLYENNRQMWSMLEERRALQASVAHDLRNPIAIMTGYVEYLQENSRGGTLTEEKLEKALSNLDQNSDRRLQYPAIKPPRAQSNSNDCKQERQQHHTYL